MDEEVIERKRIERHPPSDIFMMEKSIATQYFKEKKIETPLPHLIFLTKKKGLKDTSLHLILLRKKNGFKDPLNPIISRKKKGIENPSLHSIFLRKKKV